MGEHSIVGASSMGRWAKCTMSPSLIMTLPPADRNKGSVFADEGSSAHRLCDLGVQHINDLIRQKKEIRDVLTVDLLGTHIARYKDVDDFEVIGSNPFNPDEELAKDHEVLTGFWDHHFHCDVEMQNGVRLYLVTIIEIIEQIWEAGGKPEIWPESRCYPIPGRDDVFGTSDCVIVDMTNQKVWVIDFKFGRRMVYAQDNQQALFYSAGALASYESQIESDADVCLMIIQPRVEYDDGTSISHTWYKAHEIYEWIEGTLKPAILATHSPALARYEVGDYCDFCPAVSKCPLHDEASRNTAVAAFAEADGITLEEVDEVEMVLPDPTDPVQMGEALRIAKMVSRWATAVGDMADSLGAQGKSIPGHKLVRKVTRWRWKDSEAVLNRLREHGTLDQGTETKPKSVAQMRASGALSEDDLAELSEKPEGALTLAPESDRRKAVKSVADAFASAD